MRKTVTDLLDRGHPFHHGGADCFLNRPALDFSVNVNPLGPSPAVVAAIREAVSDIARYPDPGCRELTERLAVLHGVTPEQIVVGNGSAELIYAIPHVFPGF